jgi:hypothetical protein
MVLLQPLTHVCTILQQHVAVTSLLISPANWSFVQCQPSQFGESAFAFARVVSILTNALFPKLAVCAFDNEPK